MTTAARLIDTVRQAVADDRGSPGRDDAMRVGVLRVGEEAYRFLSYSAGWRAANGKALTVVFGVPVEVVELDRGWRLMSLGGTVIAHGEVDGS